MTRWSKNTQLLLTAGLALVLVAIVTAPALGQEPVNLRIDGLDASNFPQMDVQVSVRNNNGVPVTGLAAADFELTEDGSSLKPSEVGSIKNDDVELAVALVVDVSGSMLAEAGKPLEDAKAAANAFLNTLTADDQAAVVAFSDQVDLQEPFSFDPTKEHNFTYDKNALRNVVNFLESEPCAGTPLYDAVFKAVKITARQPQGNRAVILMTDGRDAAGVISGGQCTEAGPGSEVATEEDPIAEANRNNIPVFSIGLGSGIDRGYLQRLALRTGGTYQQTPDSAQLTSLYENIAELLKQQYLLTYTSQVIADGEHSLTVRATYGGAEASDEVGFTPPLEVMPQSTAPATLAPEEEASQEESAGVVGPTAAAPAVSGATAESPGGFLEDTLPLLVGGLVVVLLVLLAVYAVLRSQPQEDDEVYEEIPTDLYDDGVEAAAGGDGRRETPLVPATAPTDVAPGWPGTRAEAPHSAKTEILRREASSIGYFIVVDGGRRGMQLPLAGERTTIGRGGRNDIALDDSAASRDHAVIVQQDGDFYIQDLGSANGTLVNGEEITRHRLRDEDEVTVGRTALRFKFTRLKGDER